MGCADELGVFRAAHKRTKDLLTEKREEVVKVAERLLEKEILTRCVLLFPYIYTYLLGLDS